MSPTELNALIILTLLCWGVWGIFDKKALQFGSSLDVIFRLNILFVMEAPLGVVLLNMIRPGWQINDHVLQWTALAAFIQAGSIICYMVAMTLTDASLVLGITAAYPVVSQLFAVVLLGEPLVPQRILGGLAISAGIAAIGFSPKSTHASLPRGQTVVLAFTIIAATVGWGVWGVIDKIALRQGHPLEVWFAELMWEALYMGLLALYCVVRKIKFDLKNVQTWKWSALSAIALAIGRWTFLACLSISSASYIIAITGCYPLLMYILAVLWLKERFSKLRFVGILLVMVGGIAVQQTHGL